MTPSDSPSEVPLPDTASRSAAAVGPVKQRRLLDRLIPILAGLAVLVPLGVAVASVNSQAGASLTFTDRERDGVTYLRPLVRLLGATSDAQSAAAAGKSVDHAGLKTASDAVDAVDARLGAVLEATEPWGDVRTRLGQLSGTSGSARSTYKTYSGVIALELALIAHVGDTSNLILDPELDSYYVMDATLLRVPAILADSAKATSFTGMAEASSVEADRVDARVASAAVRSHVAAIDDGLNKGFRVTRSRTLASGLFTPLARLKDAVTTFAPPTLEVGVASQVQERDVEEVARTSVREASMAFESAALTELDGLLVTRGDAVRGNQRLVLALGLAGLLVAAGLTAWGAARRRGPRDRPAPDPRVDMSFVDSAPGELVGAGRTVQSPQGRP